MEILYIIGALLLYKIYKKPKEPKKVVTVKDINKQNYIDYIYENAPKYGLSPQIIIAQIKQESNFNPNAINKVSKAAGLGQFMPATWKDFGTGDIMNPYSNLNANFKLMKYILDKFDNRYDLALAGYNWGQNRQLLKNAAKNNTPFTEIKSKLPKETRDYVTKILQNAKDLII